jgi:hypothetical protein
MRVDRERLAEAIRLRNTGMGWARIYERTGVSHDAIRLATDPQYREWRNARKRIAKARNRPPVQENGVRPGIPEWVLRERDERMARWPKDLTAAICGDPV